MIEISWRTAIVFSIFSAGLVFFPPLVAADDTSAEPKSIRKTCGKCPEGYAMIGVTEAPGICKDVDPTLVQCVPLGANMLPVCGSCPEGYREIGSSSVPARCGSHDGGRLSQCQLRADGIELSRCHNGRENLSARLREHGGTWTGRLAAASEISIHSAS